MKHPTLIKVILLLAVTLMIIPVCAQPQGRGGMRWGMYGDWIIKREFNGMTMQSILSFSRDQDGNQTGVSISNWGLTELKDVSFEAGKLTYTQVRRGRDGETIETKFTGTITEGVLKGTVTGGPRGDFELTGTRAPRLPRAVGQWEMKYSMGEREMTGTMIIKADADGNLSATWPSERVESTISDVTLDRRDLSFKRVVKFQDREFASTFKGTMQRNEITGAFESEFGSMEVTGTRIGSDLIGTWNLAISSDFGEMKQRLVVNPDLSAMYGAMPVKAVKLDGNKVSFKLVMEFGQNTFEMDFAGTMADGKLTGELASDRGSQEITGTKVVRRGRGPRMGG